MHLLISNPAILRQEKAKHKHVGGHLVTPGDQVQPEDWEVKLAPREHYAVQHLHKGTFELDALLDNTLC